MIELLVVIVLISVITTISIPAIRTSLFSDQLKATSRRLIGLVNEVSSDAVRNQTEYQLNFDLGENQVWATPVSGTVGKDDSSPFGEDKVKEKRLKLPDSVRVVGIVSVSKSKSSEEEGKLYFTKKGYVEKSAIQLRSNDGREMSIVLSPFMGTTRIYDSLVGLEEDRGGF